MPRVDIAATTDRPARLADYRHELMPFRSAVIEAMRLAAAVPGGMTLLTRFAESGADRISYSERIADGVLVLVSDPSPELQGLLTDLRKRAGGAA